LQVRIPLITTTLATNESFFPFLPPCNFSSPLGCLGCVRVAHPCIVLPYASVFRDLFFSPFFFLPLLFFRRRNASFFSFCFLILRELQEHSPVGTTRFPFFFDPLDQDFAKFFQIMGPLFLVGEKSQPPRQLHQGEGVLEVRRPLPSPYFH